MTDNDKTDTPRTDAEQTYVTHHGTEPLVTQSFARQLERELAETRKALERTMSPFEPCKECDNGRALPSVNCQNDKEHGNDVDWISYGYCYECGREDRAEQLWKLVTKLRAEITDLHAALW